MKQVRWGKVSDGRSLTPRVARELVAHGHARAETLRRLPLSTILDVLQAVGDAWSHRNYGPRKEALRRLPRLIRMDPAMVESTLDIVPEILNRKLLELRIRLELSCDPACLDGWVRREGYEGSVHAAPRGVLLHVSAGNVFVGALDSLVTGLVTKNANIVKLSSVDPVFPVLFARSLAEHDPSGAVAGAVSIVPWRGGDVAVEAEFKRACDAIMVWGGAESVMAYRAGRGLSTHLVEYGPRISAALVAGASTVGAAGESIAARLAHDVALWDQSACASPQLLYFEDSSKKHKAWMRFRPLLCKALDAVTDELPPAPRSVDEAVEITKTRQMALFAAAQGEGDIWHADGSQAWTLIEEADTAFHPSCQLRTLFVKLVPDLLNVPPLLAPYRDYLQSVGLACPAPRRAALASALTAAGVTRVAHLGHMLEGKIGSPHDGRYPLNELVRWIANEDAPPALASAQSPRSPSQSWEAVRKIVAFARRRSAFYRKRLKGLRLAGPESLARIPLLDGETLRLHTPPAARDLLTAGLDGAVVYASGGSTGKPKYSFYGHDEFERVCRVLADGLAAAGLSPRDVVANTFVAGHLWSSWNAVHRVLELTGCTIVPIGGSAPFPQIAEAIHTFGAETVIGLPSILVELARHVQRHGPALRVKKIFYGGEHVTAAVASFLEEVLGARHIASACLASVDAGVIGYQCTRCTGAIHHEIPDHQYLELIDPDTDEAVSEDGEDEGEIVVTSLERRLMPILRYRTGDMARWAPGPCRCGRPGRRFELRGRCDDRIQVGSARVYAGDVAHALEMVPGAGLVFQIVATADGPRDRLVLRVEREKGIRATKALEERVRKAVLARCPDLANSLELGWLYAMDVKLLATGSIERVARTGKLRRIVDERR